jgi:hypothetical protein
VQQQIRKVPVTGGNPLSVLTETMVEEDVSKYPLSIASTGTSFTTTMEWNLKNLFHQNEEKDARIRELEEQLRHAKKDEGSLREFKACVEKVRTEA